MINTGSDSESSTSELSEFTLALREAERLLQEEEEDDQSSASSTSSSSTSEASYDSMDDSGAVKTAKVPQFDGAESAFQLFWMRFTAYAMLQKFAACLKEDAEQALPATEDEGQGETDANKAARKRNFSAMYNFTLAFTTESLMGLLFKAQTTEWPNGKAHLVVKELFKKFRPRDTISRVELRTQLNNVSMEKNDDPATLFEQISKIQNRFKKDSQGNDITLDKEDLISIVLAAAPEEYQSILTIEQRVKGVNITLDDLESAMVQQYRMRKNTTANKKKDSTGGHETNFAAPPIKSNNRNGQTYKGNNRRGRKKKGPCWTCGKGHWDRECWDKPENAHLRPAWYKPKPKGVNAAAVSNNKVDQEILFCMPTVEVQKFPDNVDLLSDPNIWIADTAATSDMTHSDQGLHEESSPEESDSARVATGHILGATKVGKLKGILCDNQGKEIAALNMARVVVTPGSPYNVLSVTRRLKEGWKLGGNENAITLTKDGTTVTFDIKIDSPKGALYAVCIRRVRPEYETNAAMTEKQEKMNIQQAHDKLGHMGEDLTRKAAKALGWIITRGTLGVCQNCAEAKAKKKSVPQKGDGPTSTLEKRRYFLDLSTLKDSKTGKRCRWVWRIMVEQLTQYKFSDFFLSKDGMVEPTIEKIHHLKDMDIGPHYLRMDNAGENLLLQKRAESKDWKLGLEYEFTARDTPQQNALAEIGFSVIGSRAKAMMNRANIPDEKRHLLIPKAIKCATKLDGLTPIDVNGSINTRYVHLFGKNPSFVKYLRTWGEAGTVTLKQKIHPKEQDKGVTCMFVGYAEDHPGDCFEMWDPITSRVHKSRDVTWLRHMFYEQPVAIEVEEGTGADDDDASIIDIEESDDEVEVTEVIKTSSGRTVKPRDRLNLATVGVDISKGFYHAELSSAEEKYYDTMARFPEAFGNGNYETDREVCCVGAGIGTGFTNTQELHVMKYDEAINGPDGDKWKQAVKEEFDRMMKSKVFEVWKEEDVPDSATVLSTTWAMKKKASGVYRARMTARGFEQLDGEHYDENDKAAPVVCDITIRVMFVLMILAGMDAEILDVKGAFLLGEFSPEHKMFLEIPKGFESFLPKGVVLLLLKTLYGTKQAAMAFWKKLIAAFNRLDYERSKADACLHFTWTDEGLLAWMSWVDDLLVIGFPKSVAEAKEGMKEEFDCDDQGPMKEYVGCKIDCNMDERWMRITQPVLLQSFHDEFGVTGTRSLPAQSGSKLQKGEDTVDAEEQTTFRSGTGKLLHCMKWSRFDILNRVRELSRFMSGATKEHLKAMKDVMEFCLSTKEKGIVLHPVGQWDGKDRSYPFVIHGLSDAEYAGDADTRRSVSGYSTFLEGAPVSAKSKMQGCVTLSVTEAEFVSACECAQDMLFVMRLLESMGLTVQKPMVLYIDNKGAVDLANNWSSAGRTRHVATKIMFLRELKEQGILNCQWISKDNMSSDIFTKNVGGADFHRHASAYVG